MGLFTRLRRPDGIELPPDVSYALGQWAKHLCRPGGRAEEFKSLKYEMWRLAQQDPNDFQWALADAVGPGPSWAAVGASRIIERVLGAGAIHPAQRQLTRDGVRHLLALGAPKDAYTPLELDTYREMAGRTGATWPERSAPPRRSPRDRPARSGNAAPFVLKRG